MTTISVIIPIYNVEEYLKECLDSVLGQDCPGLEIICIEDDSTDHSKEILSDYIKKDNRIKAIYQEENKGLSAARNIGLDYAKGKYILFLDSDDYLEQHALRKLWETAEQQEAEVISFSSRTFGAGLITNGYDGLRKNFTGKKQSGVEAFVEQNRIGDYKCTVWQYLYQRQFLEQNKIRFIEGIYHEDIAFSFCVYMCAESIYFMREILHGYRIREGSITTNDDFLIERIDSFLYSYQYCKKYIQTLELTEIRHQALKIQLDNIFYCMMDYYYKIGKEHRKKYGKKLLRIIPDSLKNMLTEKNIFLSEEQRKKLKSENHIWLYGMGEYARRWLWILESNEIWIEGIVVSSLKENSELFCDYSVYQIDEFCRNHVESITVIIGVSQKYATEIENTLKNYPQVNIFNVK